LLRRLRSALRGEVSTGDLEARRRAGAVAYSLVEEADALEGTDRSAQLFRLCAWNAFAFQTIVDTLIECDARADPPTAGYVPRSTLLFAGPCVDQVPHWVRNARMAQGDPDLELEHSLASLPKWRYDQPTTIDELVGLRTAYEALQPRVETGLQVLAESGRAAPHTLAQMRRMVAEMTSSAEYAFALLRPGLGPVDRGEVRWRLLDALGRALDLGQVLAMPSLLEVVRMQRRKNEDVPLGAGLSWLEIELGWHVRDNTGAPVGRVVRVRGDHTTGVLEGIDVATAPDRPDLVVAAGEIGAIELGGIALR
jgi:hypothetical protein